MARLQPIPAVVLPASSVGGLIVNLLPRELPNVGDVQVTGVGVEVELPRVAQAVGPDLAAGIGVVVGRLHVQPLCLADDVGDLIGLDDLGAGEGMVGRNPVWLVARRLDVDPQQLTEEYAAVLCVVVCVAAPTA